MALFWPSQMIYCLSYQSQFRFFWLRSGLLDSYCYERKKYPTVSGILEKVKNSVVSREEILHVLYPPGAEIQLQETRQKTIHIRKGHTYLQTVWKLRRDNTHDLIYTDKTWVNANHPKEHTWVDSYGKGGWKVSSRKGQMMDCCTCRWGGGCRADV